MSVYITLRCGDVCLILVAKFIYISYIFCWELLELASIMGIETIIVHLEYTYLVVLVSLDGCKEQVHLHCVHMTFPIGPIYFLTIYTPPN